MYKKFILTVVTVLALSNPSFAVGIGSYSNQSGLSTRAMALGYSFAGVADDPSALFFNPAGLTQLKGLQMEYGLETILLSAEHVSQSGVKDEMAKNSPVLPNFYVTYSHPSSRWA